MWTRLRNWWRAEGDLVGLQGMSQRMLDDMGLEREGLRDRVLGIAAEDDRRPPADAPCPLQDALRG